jgi:2,3-diketo-5-methylthio-1-phosphopentane phosphatase
VTERQETPFSITCDFDGTITLGDTVNAILSEFAEPQWLEIEEAWCAGKIGSRDCLAAQTRLVRITPKRLDQYLDAVEVDPDAALFLIECQQKDLAVRVVSDGWDWAVRRVLDRIGVAGTPIVANRLVHRGDDRWDVLFPYAAAACGSGVCKCAAASARGIKVHIGDGRSDFCVSDSVDVVFAKGELLRSRTERGLLSVPFERFASVRLAFEDLPALTHAKGRRSA